MNGSLLIHRENDWEWKFVGIWADMLDSCILAIGIANLSDYLILFKEYNNQLQILQDNLRLRNLYNQYKANNSLSEIQKMEDEIKNQVAALSDKLELFTYYKQEDMLMKAVVKDNQVSFIVI